MTLVSEWRLTGRRGVRLGWFGRMIMTVEEQRLVGQGISGAISWHAEQSRWRDARVDDFLGDLNGTDKTDVRPEHKKLVLRDEGSTDDQGATRDDAPGDRGC